MPERPLVLLVDDEVSIIEELVWHLEQRGWEVLTATDGIKGEQLWKKHSNALKLVVTDIRMPGLPGQSLVRNISAVRKTVHPVLFIMTAYDDVSREEAHNLGADAIFQKPFRVRDLVAAAEHFMKLGDTHSELLETTAQLKKVPSSKLPQ
jgi:two-component system alkaline phosphatase synthesis response regulator PhoP